MKEITEATERFITEAIKKFGITDPKAINAIRQAAFRAAGYTETAVLGVAEEYMNFQLAAEMRRRVFDQEGDINVSQR